MARQFRLQIVTQEGTRFDGQVDSVTLPGEMGYFGVRIGHAAMIAALKIGIITAKIEGKNTLFACSGGLARVSTNEVVVLGDAIEAASEIDIMRAQQSEERARDRYEDRKADVDHTRAELALKRALNRLRVRDKARGL